MEFTQYKCPVCKKQFESGDDIVVCPECGAPHHRECYENNGHCFYEDKHSKDFSFNTVIDSDTKNEEIVCPVCSFKNKSGAFFCDRCGSPLNENIQNNQNQGPAQNPNIPFGQQYGNNPNAQNPNPRNGQTPPYRGFGANGIPSFDPLAGMNSEEEIADGVKVGEMAKYVGKNTTYFLLVFDRIRRFNRSKFNFAAFLFSGIYFLYRKMYTLGIIFSLVIIVSNVAATYIYTTPAYSAAYQEVMSYISSGTGMSGLQALSAYQNLGIIYLPEMLNILRYALMIFSGFLANRLYQKHCVKSIKKIKEENSENIDEKLSQKGGVNLAIALSFGIATIAISFICQYIQLTTL